MEHCVLGAALTGAHSPWALQPRTLHVPGFGQVLGSLSQQSVFAMQVPLQQISLAPQSWSPPQPQRPSDEQISMPGSQQTGSPCSSRQQTVVQFDPVVPKTSVYWQVPFGAPLQFDVWHVRTSQAPQSMS